MPGSGESAHDLQMEAATLTCANSLSDKIAHIDATFLQMNMTLAKLYGLEFYFVLAKELAGKETVPKWDLKALDEAL